MPAALVQVMDDEASFPEGPHFSKEFYSMILPLIGSFFTITGTSQPPQPAPSPPY